MDLALFSSFGKQLAHDLAHLCYLEVDDNAPSSGVVAPVSVVIAGVATITKTRAGNHAIGYKASMVITVQSLMAAKCVPPAAEISIWVFDYGLILKVIKVEDTSLATVYTDVERGRAGF